MSRTTKFVAALLLNLTVGVLSQKTPLTPEAEGFLATRFFEECHAGSGFYNSQSNIKLLFYIYNLINFSDVNERVAIYATLSVGWEDECIRWDRNVDSWNPVSGQLAKINHFEVNASKFWKPRVIHSNSPVDIHSVEENGETVNIKAFRNGWVEWAPKGMWITTCTLELLKFPYDVQTCVFTFELDDTQYSSNISGVEIIAHSQNDLSQFTSPGSSWELTAIRAERGISCYPIGNPMQKFCASQAHFYLTLKRRINPYVHGIIIPVVTLSLLMLSPFAIAPHVAQRTIYATTILLSFAVINTMVQNIIPLTAERVYMINYINVSMITCTVITLYTALSAGLAEYLKGKENVREIKLCKCSLSLVRFIDLVVFFVIFFFFLLYHIIFFALMQG